MNYLYRLSGYIVETNVFLPELVPVSGKSDYRVMVREQIPESIPVSALQATFYASETQNMFCVYRKSMGLVAVWDNHLVEYIPPSFFTADEIRMSLLGPVFMITASVLGDVVLHAACVIINKEAVLFCGKPGSGKSSLAAWFYAKGYPLLSDDVSIVQLNTSGKPIVYPSVPRIKLSADALEKMGQSSLGLDLVSLKKPKYGIPVKNPVLQQNYPISAIVFPAFDKAELAICRLEPIKDLKGKKELSLHLYRKGIAAQLPFHVSRKKITFALISQVPMYTFYRPFDETGMNSTFEFIEKELLSRSS